MLIEKKHWFVTTGKKMRGLERRHPFQSVKPGDSKVIGLDKGSLSRPLMVACITGPSSRNPGRWWPDILLKDFLLFFHMVHQVQHVCLCFKFLFQLRQTLPVTITCPYIHMPVPCLISTGTHDTDHAAVVLANNIRNLFDWIFIWFTQSGKREIP